jgi:dihydrofolate reductase
VELRGATKVVAPKLARDDFSAASASWPSARIIDDIAEIRALKQQPGQAVYVVGGPGLLSSLIQEGLLDELRLIVHPVVVGSGLAVFGGLGGRQAVELVSAEPTPTGRLHLTYRVRADAEPSQ